MEAGQEKAQASADAEARVAARDAEVAALQVPPALPSCHLWVFSPHPPPLRAAPAPVSATYLSATVAITAVSVVVTDRPPSNSAMTAPRQTSARSGTKNHGVRANRIA